VFRASNRHQVRIVQRRTSTSRQIVDDAIPDARRI